MTRMFVSSTARGERTNAEGKEASRFHFLGGLVSVKHIGKLVFDESTFFKNNTQLLKINHITVFGRYLDFERLRKFWIALDKMK